MSKTAHGDKYKINKNIITVLVIRHVLICPNQVAKTLPGGDKSPSQAELGPHPENTTCATSCTPI